MTRRNFSISIVARLFRKMLRENSRGFLLTLVMTGGILLLMMIFFSLSGSDYNSASIPLMQFDGVKILFIVFGCIAGSMMFSGMETPSKRLGVLMTPASTAEKFTVRFVTFTIGYIVAFALLTCLADMINYLIFAAVIHIDNYHPSLMVSCLSEAVDARRDKFFIAVYLILTSAFALGSIIWPKKALLKTFFTLAILTIAYAFLARIGASLADTTVESGGYYIYQKPGNAIDIMAIVCSVTAVVFYVIAYFRFKESEIIDRW